MVIYIRVPGQCVPIGFINVRIMPGFSKPGFEGSISVFSLSGVATNMVVVEKKIGNGLGAGTDPGR